MDYKEIRIDTLRQILLCVYNIYTTICDRDTFTPIDTNAPRCDAIQSLIYLDSGCRKTADDSPFVPGKQYYYANSMGMIWSFGVDDQHAYLLGPAFTDNYSILDIVDKLESRHISQKLKLELKEFMNEIPIVPAHRMQQYSMMLHCCLTGETLPFQNMEMLNDQIEPPSSGRISEELSTNYILEQKLWKAIREGNLNYQKELDRTLTNLTPGMISNGNILRQDKNLAIVQVALSCRAAVEGGLSPEIAYPLSDQYIRTIESCRNVSEVMDISVGMIEDYIRRVHQVKLQSGISTQIRDCCGYISMHPEENPDIRQMAQKYGYTTYYFSKKFKQEVGISIRDFAMVQKIEKAKELLTQSAMNILDISEFLGFNSQSYFGSVFRSITGMTPSEYQEIGCAEHKEI